MYIYYFIIARHIFLINAEKEILWDKEHKKFIVDSIEGIPFPKTVFYIFSHSGEPKLAQYPLLYHQGSQYVYQGKEGQLRVHYLIGTEISIICEEKKDAYYISIESVFWHQSYMYLIAMMLEKVLLKSDALILHSSYIRYREEAILFTAPSGTGKSTQADLWKKYTDCSIINGDRTVLQKREGRWYACGFPICGSSEICHNVDTPIRGIVYLSQAPNDSIKRICGVEALKRIMSEISINYWNPQFVDQAMGLIEDLLSEIPFYHLFCTKEKSAVELLYETLKYEGNLND